MSLLTSLLKLFKWNTTDETDLEQEFDIDKAMNDNWDKLDDFAERVNDAVIEIQDDIEEIQNKNTEQDETINTINESISSIQAKDEAQDTELDKQSELIQKLKDNCINITTEEATSLHVENASTVPARLEVRGNHSQKVTKIAENVFDGKLESGAWDYGTGEKVDNASQMRSVDYIDVEGQTQISIVKKDGGTFTVGIRYYDADKNYIGRTSINDVTDAITTTIVNNLDDSKTVKYATLTFTQSTDTSEVFGINKGADLTWHDFIPNSPSLDYPSPVRAVGDNGSVEVKKINSNIMPILELGSYWKYTEKGIQNIEGNSGHTITSFNLKKGQTIKVGFKLFSKPTVSTSFTGYIDGAENTNLNLTNINNFNLNQVYTRTYTATKDCKFGYVMWGNSNTSIFEFQLWANLENAEDYQQYEEQSYILDIQKPMLLGDYFVKEADGWKEVHIWNKLIFTGQENWNKSGASTDEIFVTTLDIENGVDRYGYSNYFRYYGYVEIGCFSVYNNGANIRFCVDSSVISDINRFKTMLADKYASGDSVYVYYKLSTLNKLACTEAQSNILDQLSELPLFAGTNNIITAESLALMQMQYIADTETYIDNRIDEKLANINQQILEIAGGN